MLYVSLQKVVDNIKMINIKLPNLNIIITILKNQAFNPFWLKIIFKPKLDTRMRMIFLTHSLRYIYLSGLGNLGTQSLNQVIVVCAFCVLFLSPVDPYPIFLLLLLVKSLVWQHIFGWKTLFRLLPFNFVLFFFSFFTAPKYLEASFFTAP